MKLPVPPLSEKSILLPNGQRAPTELDMVREKHRRGVPGLSLAEFVVAGWKELEPSTPLQWNWHLDAVCSHVEALLLNKPGPIQHESDCGYTVGESHAFCPKCLGKRTPCPQNLLLNVPPGSMKSLIFAVFAPAWIWLFRPSWRAIFASGSPGVVTRDSLKCRTLIQCPWYQTTFKPSWKISADQNEKQLFANTAGGFRKGMGAGTAVTGERADFLGVDDPNDAKEIASKVHRNAINENWWDAAFHNRIADPTLSKRAIIMQRLHEDDLAGYVLTKEKGQWAHLAIAMEYEVEKAPGDRPTWLGWQDPRHPKTPGEVVTNKDGVIIRGEGALMFPVRFTPVFLAGERLTLGSAGYAGQMQQRPVAAAGNRFKRDWWRYYSPTGTMCPRPTGANAIPPRTINVLATRFDEMVGSWDCAFKATDGSDYVVGLVVGRIGADKYVIARKRARMTFTETKKAVAQQRLDWPDCYEILVEDKANGTAVIESLASEISGVIAVEPKGGKEARAAAIEPQVEAGNVFLPEGAEWLDEWVEEFAAFPRGRNDDQVDALSQALTKLSEDSEVAAARALLGIV